MKKLNIYNLFIFLLLPLLGACSKDEIVFESEFPRFETRPGYELIEAIVPQETSPSDKIYIIGEFNGGMDAVGDPRWELEKAPDTDAKWGIYLNPADFIDGKTLADGYTFYNVEQGEERAIGNKTVTHTDAPAVGGRLNVLIYFWADYFNKPQNPSDVDHDGYAIYVVDNSGYDDLALYAWGDATIFGEWPGIKPTGKINIDGINYQYFDTGADNEGLTVNLIFNNNGGGQQLDDYSVTLDQDYYLELTPAGVVEFDPNGAITHDGYVVYVNNLIGWADLHLYAWGSVEIYGAWPGIKSTGTQTINGVTYTYFDLGADNCDGGLSENLIINDGEGGTGHQFDLISDFNMDHDIYIELSTTGVTIIDPDNYTPGTPVTPEPEPEPAPGESTEYKLYVENQTGWGDLWIYSWGDNVELCGAWPGIKAYETVDINGTRYEVFSINADGETANLIFHNNEGTQYDAMTVTMDKNYMIVAYPDKAELK